MTLSTSSIRSGLLTWTRRRGISSSIVQINTAVHKESPTRFTHSLIISTQSRTIPRIAISSQCYLVSRYFSKDGSKDDKDHKSKQPPSNKDTSSIDPDDDDDDDDDPFGIHFEDGSDIGKLGPIKPPKYIRDVVTGMFTGEEEKELTEREKKLLKMDTIEEQEYLLDKVMKEWNIDIDPNDDSYGADPYPEPKIVSKLAKRIREDNIGMNVLGRSVESQSFRGKLEDGEDSYQDGTGFSKPLSPAEFKVLKKHMNDEYDTDIDEGDIPVEPTNQSRSFEEDDDSILGGYADTEELNTKWMSSSAMRFMDDTKDDDPFSDLLPSDLSPARLVNRRKAKAIPRQLLHHNNLALLRRYITPSGQIMNRVQSRLGAKDQRKIAKLIKRARHLGLIPTAGQFIVEAHGNIHEEDINEDRGWEKELKQRGLVVVKKKTRVKLDR